MEKAKRNSCEIVLPQDMVVATKLNREQVMLGLNAGEEKVMTASVDATASKGASAMSKGAPTKPGVSTIESPTQSMETSSIEQMTRNEARIW
jgi:hypothetical protein